MKQFLDFLPLVAFFAAYFGFTDRDLIVATVILIGAQIIVALAQYLLTGELDKQTRMLLVIVIVFGGLTVVLNDATFIQWKPTIVNWSFAVILAGSQFIGDRNILQRMLGDQMELETRVWRNLAWGWTGGFFLAGVLNLVVAYNFSEEFWVSYKVFGGFAITLTYVIATITYLVAGGHVTLEEEDEPETSELSEGGSSQ